MFRDNHPADFIGELCGVFGLIWAASELQTRLGEFGPLVFIAGVAALFFAVSGLGTLVAVFDNDDEEDEE